MIWSMSIDVVSVNVNGIRAAVRKGMVGWLEQNRPDIVTFQEVRAPDEIFRDLMGDGWHLAHEVCEFKGRAGVAVASRLPILEERYGLPELTELDPDFSHSGRWIETVVDTGADRPVTVVSAYVHTGDSDDDRRMAEKLAFMDVMIERVDELRSDGSHVLLTGDLNVAHTNRDIRNWKGNIGRAGFREDERERLDRLFGDMGFTDVVRSLAGDVEGPYTWWTYRGRAYENDVGWRIDYQIADPDLAALATRVTVDRSMPYGERWSDHAPLTVSFDL